MRVEAAFSNSSTMLSRPVWPSCEPKCSQAPPGKSSQNDFRQRGSRRPGGWLGRGEGAACSLSFPRRRQTMIDRKSETIRGGGTEQHHWPTLRNAVEDYLIHLRATGRSAATIDSYAGSLAALKAVLGSDASLEALSPDALDAAVAGMNEAGEDQVQRSQTTLNRYRSTYRGFGRWAFETGRARWNPAARLRLARADSPPTTPIKLAE